MANLIIKSSANDLVIQGSDASPAITVGTTGTTTFAENATFSGGAIGVGGLKSMQVFQTAGTFTAGSAGSWIKPSGITTIKVYVTGGGGGGGGKYHGVEDKSPAGGAGGTAIEIIDVSSVASVTVTIGAGGAGGGNGATEGSGGTTSHFGSYCSGTGGGGGDHGNTGNKAGGAGGVGTGGQINIRGCGGGSGSESHQYGQTAVGGASFWGGHGIPSGYPNTTATASEMGAGGAGGDANASNGNPAKGGDGVCVVEEYS